MKEKVNLKDYEIDKEKLQQELNKQMTGAIEFALLMNIDDSSRGTASLFASAHGGMGLKEYLEELLGYLINVGILRRKE